MAITWTAVDDVHTGKLNGATYYKISPPMGMQVSYQLYTSIPMELDVITQASSAEALKDLAEDQLLKYSTATKQTWKVLGLVSLAGLIV